MDSEGFVTTAASYAAGALNIHLALLHRHAQCQKDLFRYQVLLPWGHGDLPGLPKPLQ